MKVNTTAPGHEFGARNASFRNPRPQSWMEQGKVADIALRSIKSRLLIERGTMTKSRCLTASLLCTVLLAGAAVVSARQLPGPEHRQEPLPEPSTLLSFYAALAVGGGVLLLGRLRKVRK